MKEAPEFLTVPELAQLLRIKERKVYDLAASGDVPCTRATGKLLFPESEIRNWIGKNQSGDRAARPAVFLGSHDPLLEWALRQSQCGLATFFDGSSDGLRRFASGEGIATGLHIRNGNEDGWNTDAVKAELSQKDVVLLSWAQRQRGLVFRQGDTFASLEDLAGRRVATRQESSGTSSLFAKLVTDAGVKDFSETIPFHSEQDAVLAVQEGDADVAFGLEAFASQFGLSFKPIITECFDLLVDRAAYFDAPFQTFLSFCQSDRFKDRAATLSGYSVEGIGQVRWNA